MIQLDDTGEYVGIHEGLDDFSDARYGVGDFSSSGGVAETFYILTESGFIINTESNDRLRREVGGVETFYVLAENNDIINTENNDMIRGE